MFLTAISGILRNYLCKCCNVIGWATRIPSAIRLQWLKVVCKIYIDVFSFLRSSWEAFKYNWMITRITFLRSLFYFPSSSRSANWMTHHYLRDLPFSYSFSFLRQPSWISYDRWSVVLIIKLSRKNVFKQKQNISVINLFKQNPDNEANV